MTWTLQGIHSALVSTCDVCYKEIRAHGNMRDVAVFFYGPSRTKPHRLDLPRPPLQAEGNLLQFVYVAADAANANMVVFCEQNKLDRADPDGRSGDPVDVLIATACHRAVGYSVHYMPIWDLKMILPEPQALMGNNAAVARRFSRFLRINDKTIDAGIKLAATEFGHSMAQHPEWRNARTPS